MDKNVDPKYYGEPKAIDSDDYHLQRDIFELALIKEAIKQKKPIFSVCRGTQLFNVAMGGSLYQDIEDHGRIVPLNTPLSGLSPNQILFFEKSMAKSLISILFTIRASKI